MLSDWIVPNDIDWFIATHLGRRPHAAPGVARDAVALFDWPTLDAVLGSPLPVDALTVARGHLVDVPRPRSAAAALQLMSTGVSVVVRAAEHHDDGLRALAASFERHLPARFTFSSTRRPAGATATDGIMISSTCSLRKREA